MVNLLGCLVIEAVAEPLVGNNELPQSGDPTADQRNQQCFLSLGAARNSKLD